MIARIILVADIPTESVRGSVVIDREGAAWQRLGETWCRARGNEKLMWPVLIATLDPLTVVHIP